MKISIKNFISIPDATLRIDGISVLTGMNDSGKTTLGKLIFSLLNAPTASNREVSFIEEAFDNIEEITPKENFLSYCQTLQLEPSLPSLVEATDGENKITFSIKGENIALTTSGKMRVPIFLLDPLTLGFYKEIFKSHKTNFLKSITETSKASIEEVKFSANLIEKINSYIKGELVYRDGELFFSKNGKLRRLFATSAGVRIFKTISTMLEHNSLNDETLLIVDNLEMFLHPNLQLVISEMLVDIASVLGCQILLMTHSPYIVDGINCYSRRSKFKKINFFLSSKADGKIALYDSSDDISRIIDELSAPLAILEKLDI